MKKSTPTPPYAEEWDLSEGMGILPEGISLTQNIGCVGSSVKKNKSSKPKKEK